MGTFNQRLRLEMVFLRVWLVSQSKHQILPQKHSCVSKPNVSDLGHHRGAPYWKFVRKDQQSLILTCVLCIFTFKIKCCVVNLATC